MGRPDPARSDLARVVAGLEAIIDAAAGVLAAQSFEATLRGMADALAAIVPYTSLAVFEVDEAAGVLVPLFATGHDVEQTMSARLALEGSLTGRAIRTGQVYSSDYLSDVDPQYQIPGTDQGDGEALIIAPLHFEDTVVAALNVWREEPQARFDPDEEVLLDRFATLAALAYGNALQREQLREQALTDALTGAYNRRHFEERLRAALNTNQRAGCPTAVVLLDVDDFKAINDRHGHAAGDRVLIDLVQVLQRGSREGDVVCRVGGEEFAVVLADGDEHAVRAWGERVLQALRDARLGPDGRLTASAGAAVMEGGVDVAEALMREADEALLTAKRTGKDRLVGP